MKPLFDEVGHVAWERYSFSPLSVLVPNGANSHGIANGSAIVTTVDAWSSGQERLIAYYESGLFNPDATFLDCLLQAAGRAITRYPTSAVACLPRTEFSSVGVFWAGNGRLVVDDQDRLNGWARKPVVGCTGTFHQIELLGEAIPEERRWATAENAKWLCKQRHLLFKMAAAPQLAAHISQLHA